MTRAVTYEEAGNLIVAWFDRRFPASPDDKPVDFSLEDDCEAMCRWLADDPERDLDDVPAELVRHLNVRILFVTGVCVLRKHEVIMDVPDGTTDADILAALLGVQIAETRLPAEWRLQ